MGKKAKVGSERLAQYPRPLSLPTKRGAFLNAVCKTKNAYNRNCLDFKENKTNTQSETENQKVETAENETRNRKKAAKPADVL